MLLLNQALHTLQHYQESAVDLSKLGMQSCVFYIQMVWGLRNMLNPTQPLKRPSKERGCCCQINKALHTVLYYQESAVDLVKLGIQSNVIYN